MPEENDVNKITIDMSHVTLDASALTPVVGQIYLNTAYLKAILDNQNSILSLLEKKDKEVIKSDTVAIINKYISDIGMQLEKHFPPPGSKQTERS